VVISNRKDDSVVAAKILLIWRLPVEVSSSHEECIGSSIQPNLISVLQAVTTDIELA
jgi:hypothetical protein